MLVFILGLLVSLIPTAALFCWLRSFKKGDAAHQTLCNRSLRGGALCSFAVLAVSGVFEVALRLTGLRDTNALLYQALHTFVVLALTEEAVKFLAFRRVLMKTDAPCSWLDVTMMMTLVGLGFGAVENVFTAISSGVEMMLIRGVTIAHGGYGFVVGYYYGKGARTDKNGWKALGFLLMWLVHGLYDFSLSEEFVALHEDLMMVAVALTFLDLVLAVVLVVFFAKARKKALYTLPLRDDPAYDHMEEYSCQEE